MELSSDKSIITTLNDFSKNLELYKKKILLRLDSLSEDQKENYKEFYKYFILAIDLFKELDTINTSHIPKSKLMDIISMQSNFVNVLNKIVDAPYNFNPIDYASHINYIQQNYPQWFEAVSPIVSYNNTRTYSSRIKKAEIFLSSVKEIQEDLKNQQNESQNKLKTYQENIQNRIDKILDDAQAVAAKVSVKKHADNFKDAANNFSEYQRYWLWTICGTIFIMIVYSLSVFWLCPIKLEEPYLYSFLQAALPRFTGLIALFYWLVICSRNYRAQAHNYIVNNNKYNALCTFETFVKATDDEEIKNAVLLQTTKAIFSNPASGYLKNDSGDEPATQVVEIVKGVSKILNK